VRAKGSTTRYGEEVVDGPPEVWRIAMEHLQNLNNVLAAVERAGAIISEEKSDWWGKGVKLVGFICTEAGRWLQASKVDTARNRPRCEHHAECRSSLGLCTYHRISIPEYAIVAGLLFRILLKDVEFQWGTEEKQAMGILKEDLCNAHALNILDVSDGAGQLVIAVDPSSEGWGAIS